MYSSAANRRDAGRRNAEAPATRPRNHGLVGSKEARQQKSVVGDVAAQPLTAVRIPGGPRAVFRSRRPDLVLGYLARAAKYPLRPIMYLGMVRVLQFHGGFYLDHSCGARRSGSTCAARRAVSNDASNVVVGRDPVDEAEVRGLMGETNEEQQGNQASGRRTR